MNGSSPKMLKNCAYRNQIFFTLQRIDKYLFELIVQSIKNFLIYYTKTTE